MSLSLFEDAGRLAVEDEEAEARALISLSLVPGVGPGRIRAVLARFRSAARAMKASPRTLAEVPGIGPQTARAIAAFDGEQVAEEQLRRAESVGAWLLPLWDVRFPRLLQQIYDPPAFLWVRGDLMPEDERAVAVVGTRRATEYGRSAAHDLAQALAERGLTVVSGLAYGIDGAAHRGALVPPSGRTLTVLGSGVDRIYPARHTKLAEAIEQRGAILSEYPMGAAPDAPNFPRRNRIVSGLALGTLVVEAFEKGGALITARLAVEQNREVFAIPSAIQSRAGAGANRLIQRGHAKLVLDADDILEELGLAASEAPPAPPPADLGPIEQKLYNALSSEPVHIDALCAQTGLDASTALVYLLSLEFKGLVRQMAGKQFFKT